MRTVILVLSFLAITYCQIFPYTVSSSCSSVLCDRSYWNANNTQYSLACPKSGSKQAQFRQLQNSSLYLDLTAYNMLSSDQKVTLPLNYNSKASVSGIQYSSQLKNSTIFVVLNCTLSAARKVTTLCNSYQLVGGKAINSTFIPDCAFGLDYAPKASFLQDVMTNEEDPFNFLQDVMTTEEEPFNFSEIFA